MFSAESIFGISVCVLAVIYLGLMAGCGTYQKPDRENFEIKMEPSKGYCKDWSLVEMEIRGHTLCSERRMLNDYRFVCTRKLGHMGAHHMHGVNDCIWIW